MQLTKLWKIIVGIATGWVVLYPLLFFAVWLLMFGSMVGLPLIAQSMDDPAAMPTFMMAPFGLFFLIFPLHILTISLFMGLMVFYLVHLIKNRAGSETIRIILGVGNFFMPYISMPIYYYAFIWRDTPPDWALEK